MLTGWDINSNSFFSSFVECHKFNKLDYDVNAYKEAHSK